MDWRAAGEPLSDFQYVHNARRKTRVPVIDRRGREERSGQPIHRLMESEILEHTHPLVATSKPVQKQTLWRIQSDQ